MNPLNPDRMTPTERLAEVTRLLALGLIRLRCRQSSQCRRDPGRAGKSQRPGVAGRIRHHGPGADRRRRADARPAGRGRRGIGWDVPALTINKMRLSGLDAIALADQLIRAGEFDVVVAGGQESMTKAPHLLMDSRAGYKYGDVTWSTTWPTTACTMCSPISRWAR